MKRIELTEKWPTLQELLNLASEENVIVRLPNGQEFLLAEVDDIDREIELIRANEELMRLLDARSQESKTFAPEEVKKLLDLE